MLAEALWWLISMCSSLDKSRSLHWMPWCLKEMPEGVEMPVLLSLAYLPAKLATSTSWRAKASPALWIRSVTSCSLQNRSPAGLQLCKWYNSSFGSSNSVFVFSTSRNRVKTLSTRSSSMNINVSTVFNTDHTLGTWLFEQQGICIGNNLCEASKLGLLKSITSLGIHFYLPVRTETEGGWFSL